MSVRPTYFQNVSKKTKNDDAAGLLIGHPQTNKLSPLILGTGGRDRH